MLKNWAAWIGAALGAWAFQFFCIPNLNPYYAIVLLMIGINIILTVSLNLVNGFTGQFSMGHAGFMAVGAYASAILTVTFKTQFPEYFAVEFQQVSVFVFSIFVGGLAAGLAGILVGLPSLRLKGDYLAIVTLGFGEIIRVIFLNVDAVGGARGLAGIPPSANFGWVYSFVLFTIFVIWRTLHSSYGRACLAVREDEIAAESMGVPTTLIKVKSFALSSFFAGVAGGLFAHTIQYINPTTFDFNRSFEVIIMVVLGGMGSITGSVFAAIALTLLKEGLRSLKDILGMQSDPRMVIYSLMLILMMLTRPQGLFAGRELSDFLPESWRKRMKGQAAT